MGQLVILFCKENLFDRLAVCATLLYLLRIRNGHKIKQLNNK